MAPLPTWVPASGASRRCWFPGAIGSDSGSECALSQGVRACQDRRDCSELLGTSGNSAGIHRIIWGFTSILRDFVYELFKKYASEEFCTIENIHKCMYSNQCVLHYINDFNMKTQYWEKIGVEFVSQTSTDYVLGMYGNTNFIYNRCE